LLLPQDVFANQLDSSKNVGVAVAVLLGVWYQVGHIYVYHKFCMHASPDAYAAAPHPHAA